MKHEAANCPLQVDGPVDAQSGQTLRDRDAALVGCAFF
jgi:hypothetical protein